jgi:hypothetical protein
MDPNTSNNVFDAAFSALLTPLGMVAACLCVLIAFAALVSRGWCWILLALAMWVSTFAVSNTETNTPTGLWGPLELIVVNGRLLATGAMLSVLLPCIFASRGWRPRIVTGAAIAFLALELVFSARLLLAGLTVRGLSSIGIYLMIFIILTRGIGAWLQEPRNALAAIRTVAFAGMIFIGANAVQAAINSASVFYGTSGNPQHLAMDAATFLPAILFVLLRREERKVMRIALGATLGLLIVMIAMSGSRTGALMVIVALVALFRRWLKQFLKLAVIGCVVIYAALLIFPDATIQEDRFTSTTDTRSAAWSGLFDDFVAHPVFGIVYDAPAIRESSYLSVAGRLGLVGVIPMLFLIVLTFRLMTDLRRARPYLGEYAMLADTVSASMISLAVGASTEGYMLGTLVLQVFMIYLDLTVAAFMVDWVAQGNFTDPIEQEEYLPAPQDVFIGGFDF